jgi:hypothetical protein
MVGLGVLAYFAFGFLQILAFVAGIKLWLGVGTFVAVLIGLGLGALIPLGGVFASIIAFYGAYKGWGLQWWQAALVCAPFLVLSISVMGGAGLAMGAKGLVQSLRGR